MRTDSARSASTSGGGASIAMPACSSWRRGAPDVRRWRPVRSASRRQSAEQMRPQTDLEGESDAQLRRQHRWQTANSSANSSSFSSRSKWPSCRCGADSASSSASARPRASCRKRSRGHVLRHRGEPRFGLGQHARLSHRVSACRGRAGPDLRRRRPSGAQSPRQGGDQTAR